MRRDMGVVVYKDYLRGAQKSREDRFAYHVSPHLSDELAKRISSVQTAVDAKGETSSRMRQDGSTFLGVACW